MRVCALPCKSIMLLYLNLSVYSVCYSTKKWGSALSSFLFSLIRFSSYLDSFPEHSTWEIVRNVVRGIRQHRNNTLIHRFGECTQCSCRESLCVRLKKTGVRNIISEYENLHDIKTHKHNHTWQLWGLFQKLLQQSLRLRRKTHCSLCVSRATTLGTHTQKQCTHTHIQTYIQHNHINNACLRVKAPAVCGDAITRGTQKHTHTHTHIYTYTRACMTTQNTYLKQR